jgi:hypothetical protein
MSEQLCIAPLFPCGKSLCSGHQTQFLIGFDQHLTNKKLKLLYVSSRQRFILCSDATVKKE